MRNAVHGESPHGNFDPGDCAVLDSVEPGIADELYIMVRRVDREHAFGDVQWEYTGHVGKLSGSVGHAAWQRLIPVGSRVLYL